MHTSGTLCKLSGLACRCLLQLTTALEIAVPIWFDQSKRITVGAEV